jgi:hypothetical protein
MNWQPIDTAPKDCIVLLYRPTQRYPWAVVAPGQFQCDQYAKRPRPFWESWLRIHIKLDDRDYPPTHWMPLPAPPQEQADG